MSIILGLWNRDGEPVEERLLQAMLRVNQPAVIDREDTWHQAEVGLACQHFWITPEEVGQAQPRLDAESGCALVCSARLDNRPELLRRLGIAEQTENPLSDGDLILAAYIQWGTGCPKYLLGDFAFILWDVKQRQIFAARDALGAVDLYYYLDPQHWIAASRINTLLAHQAIQPRLNEVKIAEYLAVEWGDDVNTFYASITHLPPAHCLLVTGDGSKRWRFWDVDPGIRIRYKRTEEYAEHYRELIREALRCRMRSAYPVGFSLSGGLDSSTLTCLAAQITSDSRLPQERLWSFSYVFDHLPSCDERSYIQAVLEQASNWHPIRPVLIPGDDLYPAPMEMDWLVEQDYPYQDPYYYLLRAILQSARAEGLRLMINGYYGDDLYSGGDFWLADLLREGRIFQATRTWRGASRRVTLKHDGFDYGLRALAPRRFKAWYRHFRPRVPDYIQWLHPRLASLDELRQLKKAPQGMPELRLPGGQARYTALFQAGYPITITVFQDQARYAGMQYAFPFLDRRLVEFVLGAPPEVISSPGRSRRVLREAMSGILPEMVRQRVDKAGLMELYERGIYQKNFQDISAWLTHARVVERNFLRRDWFTTELSGTEGRTQDGFVLWMTVCLENWLQKYW